MALLLGALTLAGGASAATLTVTNLADSGPGTLRQRIAETQPNDTIDFAVTGTITLTSGELVIQTNLTIQGPGATNLTVSGNDSSRVFHVADGAVTIAGLGVSKGWIYNSYGAGILNYGRLLVRDCNVFSNVAVAPAAGISGTGGGIYNFNVASVTNCWVTGNQGHYAGGGLGNLGDMTIQSSTISSNIAGGGAQSGIGGALFNQGTLTMNNATVSGNAAHIIGGVLCQGTARLEQCTVVRNASGGGNGSARDFRAQSGSVVVFSSILGEVDGTWVSQGFNVVEIAVSGSGLTNGFRGDYVGSTETPVDSRVAPLADNGGFAPTHALWIGSPAIDRGSNATGRIADQRGFPRTFNYPEFPNAGDGTDSGAYELALSLQLGQDLIVNNLDDHDDGFCTTGDCTLREALRASHYLSNRVIQFASQVQGTIVLTQGALTVERAVELHGPDVDHHLIISGNSASRIFHLREGRLLLANLSLADAHAGGGVGGAILTEADSELVTRRCDFKNNVADSGGAIHANGRILVFNSRFMGNEATTLGGGAIALRGTNVESSLCDSTLSGNSSFQRGGCVLVAAGGLSITNCVFTSNSVTELYGGGSLANLGTLRFVSSTCSNNSAISGGAIVNNGVLEIVSCGFFGNSASGSYGGGGIDNQNQMLLLNSTLAGNFGRSGGGVANYALAEIQNCTISGNVAGIGDAGGVWNSGLLSVSSSTIVSNKAIGSAGGGIRNHPAGTAFLRNVLIAQNEITNSTYGPDCFGDFISEDFNFIYVTNGAAFAASNTHSIYAQAPLLGPLQDNGGPTRTHALRPGSPALDAGHSGGLSTDQRGGARAVFSTTNTPPGDGSDIGAFEAGGFVRLTSITRSNTTAHLQLSKDLTTGPGPAYYLQRRATFGTGAWEELPGPVSGTNALLPFTEPTATNRMNFYRVRVGP